MYIYHSCPRQPSPTMSPSKFSQKLRQALEDLNSSDDEPQPSSKTFSNDLRNLLSQLPDSDDSSSEEEPSSSDSQDITPELTEDEFVPEPPDITYEQYLDEDEDQEQPPLDPAGE